MVKSRTTLGLILLALAGIAVWIAQAVSEDGLVGQLGWWAAAAVLAWKALAAFTGRIKSSEPDSQPTPPTRPDVPLTATDSPRPQDSPGTPSSATAAPDQKPLDADTGPPTARTDDLNVVHEVGNAMTGATLFMARVVVVLILCILVPVILIAFVAGMVSLFQGEVLQAIPPLLFAGWLGWYCWGPLRGHWNGEEDDEESQTDGNETERSGGFVAASAPPMTLPEEFLLLCHDRYGNVHAYDRTVAGCAAAELGELALRHRLRVVPNRKIKLFGFESYASSGKIRMLDLTPTGLAWADDLLEELGRLSAPRGRTDSDPDQAESPRRLIRLHKWLRLRGDQAFFLHRDAMIENSLLFPGAGSAEEDEEFHYPDSGVRNLLIDRLQAVNSEKVPMDERSLLLLDLVGDVGLEDELGLTLTIRQRLDHARGIGRVAAIPEDMRDTSTLLSGTIFARTLGKTAVGGDDGGDGGE